MEGLKEHNEIWHDNKAYGTWLIKTPLSDKDLILDVMTRLSYVIHDSQCTKQ